MKLEDLKNKEFEITDEGILKVVEVKKKGKFMPKKDEHYWFISNYGLLNDTYIASKYDEWLVNHQPVFRAKAEAEEYKDYLELLDKYKYNFSEEEWKNDNIKKWIIWLSIENKSLSVGYFCGIKCHNGVYFISEENAEAFIKEVGIENVKKFMFDVWE